MDYQLARQIAVKNKKELKMSSSVTIISAPTTTPSLTPLSQFTYQA